jgi:multicomponent K+:H+ antiporter subunit D
LAPSACWARSACIWRACGHSVVRHAAGRHRLGQNLLTAGLLYYLPSSTLAVAALFLLADLMDRWRNDGASAHEAMKRPSSMPSWCPPRLNLDDDEEVLIGRVIPAAAAFLGLAFMCTLVITGLPPLSGFIGKFAMLTSCSIRWAGPVRRLPGRPPGLGAGGPADHHRSVGADCADARRHPPFLGHHERAKPELRVLEGAPSPAAGAVRGLTVHAHAVMRFTQNAANALHTPSTYILAVMQRDPVPNPPKEPKPDTAVPAQTAAPAAVLEPLAAPLPTTEKAAP